MDPILDIPGPEPGDSESVVASLETAAVFGAKGDAAEALRWLQRAAESAGDGGDDHRTLALARTVATLKGRVEGRAEAPSALASSTAGSDEAKPAGSDEAKEDVEEDAAPFLLESRAVVSTARPPPPSSRAPSTGTSVKGAPTLKSTPVAKGTTSALPAPSASAPARSLTPAVPSAASSTAPPRSGTTNGERTTPGAPPTRVAAKSVTPSVLGAPPAAATAKERTGSPDPGQVAGPHRVRQAARVAVTKSLTERGLFFVRVLEEGQEPPSDAFEGVLVSSDPNVPLV